MSAAESRERERIATLLHDEVGALIVRIRLRLSEWRHSDAPTPSSEVDDVCSWLSKLSHTVRTLTTSLAPPAWHGGLPSALGAMAQELGLGLDAQGPQVTVDTSGPDFDVAEPVRSMVCRVVRELCLNVLKHAKARRLDITPRVMDGWLCIQVQDDGVGLPDKPEVLGRGGAGLGLAGARAQLRALGGSLHLRWEPGRGTCATVLIPLPGHPEMAPDDVVELPARSLP
ncbi:sensor histidine kinase [Roseateles sp. SL47]|uniref:sensor histidine kinase n=1 Tax=Roseateles sp. SL47 TaxID=2995138 RepID=UPI002D1E470C|nr:ATP-binding protein [Roseateles sp. SL47]